MEPEKSTPVEPGWPLLGILPKLVIGDPYQNLLSISVKHGDVAKVYLGPRIVSKARAVSAHERRRAQVARAPRTFKRRFGGGGRGRLADADGAGVPGGPPSVLRKFGPVDDPEIEGRRQRILDFLLETSPQKKQPLQQEGWLAATRASLRRVLANRQLTPSQDDDARIDACTDLATLERWIDRASNATSVSDVLR